MQEDYELKVSLGKVSELLYQKQKGGWEYG
jgi:hypothetical protein